MDNLMGNEANGKGLGGYFGPGLPFPPEFFKDKEGKVDFTSLQGQPYFTLADFEIFYSHLKKDEECAKKELKDMIKEGKVKYLGGLKFRFVEHRMKPRPYHDET